VSAQFIASVPANTIANSCARSTTNRVYCIAAT
jgi:hypothetical protein